MLAHMSQLCSAMQRETFVLLNCSWRRTARARSAAFKQKSLKTDQRFGRTIVISIIKTTNADRVNTYSIIPLEYTCVHEQGAAMHP
jgi:hypothetical protein